MARVVQVVSGLTGYWQQLDRARRFLARAEALNAFNEVEFQDMMWAFFQNCWHVNDWVASDRLVPKVKKRIICQMAEKSPALQVCQQLCNGTKHLGPMIRKGRGKRRIAKHQYVEMRIDAGGNAEMDCIVVTGARKKVFGRVLAHQCLAEWTSILQSQGLSTGRGA